MKILVADELYLPPVIPYALARERLWTALRSAGHELHLLVRENSASRGPISEETFVLRGISAAEDVHRQSAYDVIYVPMFDSETVGALLASPLGQLPIFVACRGPNVTYSLTCGRPLWLPISRAVTFIAASVELADRVRRAFGDDIQIRVVPNGNARPSSLPVSRADVRRQLGAAADARVCLIPGVIHHEQAIYDLWEQLARRAGDAIDVLVIAGAAADKDRHLWLQALVDRRPAPFAVRVLGGLTHQAMLALSAAADWCLFPAGTEGGRSAILDAALIGTPVIVPASATHASLSELDWVLTVPDATAESLAETFRKHQARLTQGSQDSAAHLFTVAQECQATLRCFSEAVRSCVLPRPDLNATLERWAATLPMENPGKTLAATSARNGPVLVLAASANPQQEEDWTHDARAAVHRAAARGIPLHWLIGADTDDRDWMDVFDRWEEDQLLHVDRLWIERRSQDLVVLLEELCSRRHIACLMVYGIRQAGCVAGIVARRFSIPLILVTDGTDLSRIWSEPRDRDRWAVHFADGILWQGDSPPRKLPGFVRQRDPTNAYFRESLRGRIWSPILRVMPKLHLNSRMPCESI